MTMSHRQDELWEDLGEFARFVAPLEESLGCMFKNKALLREALTTDRYWYETIAHANEVVSHRSLALIGDLVLQHLSLRWAYPKTKDRHALLRVKGAVGETERLAQIANHFKLGDYAIDTKFVSCGAGHFYENRSEFLATLFEAVIGAWSVDDPQCASLGRFLESHVFSSEWVKKDLVSYGLTSEEMERLKLGYPSLWVKKLNGIIFARLGSTFHCEPRFRTLEKHIRQDGLPEFRVGLLLGDHVIAEEWGRTRNLARRYALFRCALKLLDGDEWIREHLNSYRAV